MSKIFVSSTCYDLIDLRAELESFIEELGLTAIMSDRITSEFEVQPDQNSIETCLINLRKSDAVIVILSQRYGPSLKNSGFEDVSATHLEYREAIKNKIPVYFYVRDKLEADFNLFKSSGDESALKWVSAKDIKIFDFFKEHSKLANKQKNNWYYAFSDVIDLKTRISKDLKKESSKAIIKQMTDSGNAPCVIVSKFGSRILPGSNILSAHIGLRNFGNMVAINPNVTFFHADDFYRREEENNFEGVNTNHVKTIPTLMTGDDTQADIQFDLSEEPIQGQVVHFIIEVSYSTISGHYISDISWVMIGISGREIVSTITNYSSKKYYHSDAINHRISQ